MIRAFGNMANASASAPGDTEAAAVIMARMLVSGGRPRRCHSSIIIEVIDGTRNAVVAVPANSSQATAASNDGMIRIRPPIISVPKAKLQ